MIQMTMETVGGAPAAFARRRGPRRRVVRLWLPMILVWLLLAPIALLLSPLLILVRAAGRRDVFRLSGALVDLLAALSGTRIEVESPDALIFIRIL